VTTDSTAERRFLERRAPAYGGFSPALLRLEIRRRLRNRRTVIFALVLPVAFFLLLGLNVTYVHEKDGVGNVTAFVMISIALYGAVLSTASGGAVVSIERATGWSRQLRVTPLSAAAYIAIKMLTALIIGGVSVLAVYVVAALTHKPHMPLHVWIITALCVWIGSLLFAAFGLFIGYLLPSENVMQILGFVLTLCSFFGGLFIPINQFAPALRTVAAFTPLFGLNELVHHPLVGGAVNWTWVVNLLAWLVIFGGGAVLLFGRDTARV